MRSLFIDPGALRTELSLEVLTPVPDGQGGHAESWSEVASLFARLEPVDVRAVFGADQRLNRVTHRVTIRARADIAPGMRFAKGDRRFLILSLHDPDESGRYLVCRTEETRP